MRDEKAIGITRILSAAALICCVPLFVAYTQTQQETEAECGRPPHGDCICTRMLFKNLGRKQAKQIIGELKEQGWTRQNTVTPGHVSRPFAVWICPPGVDYSHSAPRAPAEETPNENPNPLRKVLQNVSADVGVSGGPTVGGHDDRKGDHHHLSDQKRTSSTTRSSSGKTITAACKCHPCTCSPCRCH